MFFSRFGKVPTVNLSAFRKPPARRRPLSNHPVQIQSMILPVVGARRSYASVVGLDLDATKGDRERVVILGSGWAGYVLSRTLDLRKFQILVVSPRSYFVFTPLLAECSVGTLESRTAVESIRKRGSAVDFYQAWADGVDFASKTVTLEESISDPKVTRALTDGWSPPSGHERGRGGRQGEGGAGGKDRKAELAQKGRMFSVGYDKLVIATGAYSQTFGIKGVKENALFLKDIGDARRIRRRILELFEAAVLPAQTEEMRRNLLHFAIVGGGPTGIEFAGNLHDLIREDLSKIHPGLTPYARITVYDVAPKVLPMFEASLTKYAMDTFQREGIEIKTQHTVEELRRGLPGDDQEGLPDGGCYTLRTREDGEVAIGAAVWSTGLMMNPFVQKALDTVREFPKASVTTVVSESQRSTAPPPSPSTEKDTPDTTSWIIKRHPKSGAIMVDDRLRVQLQTRPHQPATTETGNHDDEPNSSPAATTVVVSKATMNDVFALGDTAMLDPGPVLPATAQVANQEAIWLGKRLNHGDLGSRSFGYRNLGVMAYLGGRKALFQSGKRGRGPVGGGGGGGFDLEGKPAFWFWRSTYLANALSWRNRVMMVVQWMAVRIWGRDVSRF